MSVAVENFVKTIYQLDVLHHEDTKPGNIAKKLNITNAAATDMARKLSTKDLLIYEKYKPLKLTALGEKMALNVIRKHRLWESLLFNLFDMSLHDIHREAELLEHQTSDLLANRISAYLGHPKFDPHGDPIPNEDGVITTTDTSVVMSKAIEGSTYVISRLVSDNKEFFDFCLENGLINGAEIEINKQFSTSNMTQITVAKNTLLLNQDFTDIIYLNEFN
ncbi:metal-dependent transcriptional regulator [Urechidicola vernalis]|uniref:Transcriptional regulator MntR n=1 Tax=Urechidicola vernalis TaxID=3075600 RepID=A0ABU2Y8Q4_9FLAO|nr:metal-dependent transcriptional regulator [Urechidicola sp. P050]MDT0554246.1 metal-dependent transcriptional regulator [Urechidicola sp. P050]